MSKVILVHLREISQDLFHLKRKLGFFRYTFSAYPKYRVIYPKSKDPTWSALLRGASDTVNYCNIPLAVICQF